MQEDELQFYQSDNYWIERLGKLLRETLIDEKKFHHLIPSS